MPTYQTGSRTLAAIRAETTTGVIATVTGASQIRLIGGDGAKLNRAQVQSQEKLTSGLRYMGRLGYKSVEGGYESELSVGGFSDISAEAVMRSTFATATSVGFTTMTTVAVGTNTVTAAGSSWITQGIKVGDIFYLTGTTVTGDNNVLARVTAVATLTLSVVTGTFTTLAATATGTLTVLKKLVSPTGSPTRRSFTIEQLDQDITQSERFLGCRMVGFSLAFQPGQMAKLTTKFMGMDRSFTNAAYFTSPSLTTGLPLVADDSSIRYNGVDVVNFTGFNLDFAITATGVPVIGSLVTPDIFDNDLVVTGQITALRSDFANLTLYDAETEFELSILLREIAASGVLPGAFGVFMPRVKISQLSAAPPGGGDGAKVETLTLMTGPKTATSVYDYGIASFFSTAP